MKPSDHLTNIIDTQQAKLIDLEDEYTQMLLGPPEHSKYLAKKAHRRLRYLLKEAQRVDQGLIILRHRAAKSELQGVYE